MAARGHLPPAYEGRSIQAPGMMRHGPIPTPSSVSRHPLDSLPPEILERKLAAQGAEMDKLLMENKRLAATHGALRQELLVAQQEIQRVRAHIGRVQVESDIHIRGLLDKISRMEVEIKAGESIKNELQKAHLEAQSLVGARQELTAQILQATEELHRTRSEIDRLPKLHAELEGLVQEHQKLRATFEREKESNIELVHKMHGMEKNLISMAREVEKLQAEVLAAEKKVQAPTTHQNTNNSVTSPYTSAPQNVAYASSAYGQEGVYANGGYGQVGGYTSAGFVQVVPMSCADPYGRNQIQPTVSAAAEGVNPYGGTTLTYDVPGSHASTASVYDAARAGAGAAGLYDAARVGYSASAYDAARPNMVAGGMHAAARGTIAGAYDAARGVGMSSAGPYDPSRAGIINPSAHDASRPAPM